MVEAGMHAGQLLTLLIIAMALGMDAFSLGVGIGLKGIRLMDIAKLSAIIALFHMVMPLMGIFTGKYVSTLLGGVATTAAGALLLLLGGHMIYSSLRGDAVESIDYRSSWGMLLFALGVSIDSFSVGISLGMFDTDMLLTVLLFGVAGGLMSVFGLLLGRKVGTSLGGYGEACGGVILFTFGLLFLF
ncbi:manganese efflux pump MntP family protein [Paenibacillus lignilyticus]|uniref:Putative manganese efflux pump MntP n=1 Tax=Paenibacillus lignilyticus TaxID=1172615 RepID=A0ABS5CG82_9BACL|nr:manganese efflux pump [Paenibacillus lignilyticus]MBP3964853.1 manganese efflux pump [Paenibacillus lignilyticus]